MFERNTRLSAIRSFGPTRDQPIGSFLQVLLDGSTELALRVQAGTDPAKDGIVPLTGDLAWTFVGSGARDFPKYAFDITDAVDLEISDFDTELEYGTHAGRDNLYSVSFRGSAAGARVFALYVVPGIGWVPLSGEQRGHAVSAAAQVIRVGFCHPVWKDRHRA